MPGVRIRKSKPTADLQSLALDSWEAKKQFDMAQARWDALKADLAAALEEAEQKTVTVETDDGKVRATYTRGKRLDYDEPRLKKKLGAKIWKKVSKTVLDKDALKEHLDEHPDQIADVAECTDEVLFKPSIKFSPIKERK